MLAKYQFGLEALAYLKGFLANGLTLSRSFLDVPLERGEVFAYLPPDLRFSSANDFECGAALTPEQASETQQWLEKFVSDHLGKRNAACAVFEHALASSDDPWLRTFEDVVFFYGSEVYYFVLSSQGTTLIDDALDGAAAGHFFRGILTELPAGSSLSNREHVSHELMQVLKARTAHIIVGVYDQDAYLVWSKVN